MADDNNAGAGGQGGSDDLTAGLMADLVGTPGAAGAGAADKGAAGAAGAGAAGAGAAGGDKGAAGKGAAGAAGAANAGKGAAGAAGAAKGADDKGGDKSKAGAAGAAAAGAADKGGKKDFNPDDPQITSTDLRKHLKKVMGDHTSLSQTAQQKETKIAELQKKIDEFSNKRLWTDQDQTMVDNANKQLAKLESDLYGRDYAQSPEYKDKFIARFTRLYERTGKELIGMEVTVNEKGEDGINKEVKRNITKADLDRVIDAPANQRLAIAKALFGEDRETILSVARDLNTIRDEASEAVESKQKNYQSETQKRAQEAEAANNTYRSFIKQQSENFMRNNSALFDDENATPEAKEATQKGITFIEACENAKPDMPINERAARAAVVRGMAAAFPRVMHELTAARAEIARLTDEAKGFRKADPGNAGEDGGGGGGGGGADEGQPTGSDDLANEFPE